MPFLRLVELIEIEIQQIVRTVIESLPKHAEILHEVLEIPAPFLLKYLEIRFRTLYLGRIDAVYPILDPLAK